jgi:cytidine deaminase
MTHEKLILEAKKARASSRSPYSKFAVGAALLCKDGTVFYGANIENASYPLSMCAERVAMFEATMHGKGKKDFVAMAIIADAPRPVSPCGACRQVMSELLDPSTPIIMANLKNQSIEKTVAELLPYAFEESDL